jgi:hypothetical protein
VNKLCGHVVGAFMLMAVSWGVGYAIAQPIECSSPARNIAGVTDPAGHVITTQYQFDTPNLQPLLQTTINAEWGCLVAHVSGLARITDNYIVFQVSVDGVPMVGHLSGVAGVATPVVLSRLTRAPRPIMTSNSAIRPKSLPTISLRGWMQAPILSRYWLLQVVASNPSTPLASTISC